MRYTYMQHSKCEQRTEQQEDFGSQSFECAYSLQNIMELVFMFIISAKARFNVKNFPQ